MCSSSPSFVFLIIVMDIFFKCMHFVFKGINVGIAFMFGKLFQFLFLFWRETVFCKLPHCSVSVGNSESFQTTGNSGSYQTADNVGNQLVTLDFSEKKQIVCNALNVFKTVDNPNIIHV